MASKPGLYLGFLHPLFGIILTVASGGWDGLKRLRLSFLRSCQIFGQEKASRLIKLLGAKGYEVIKTIG
jgi:hypothetical protein